MTRKDPLRSYLEQASHPDSPGMQDWGRALASRARNPEGVVAVLLYGSGLWQTDPDIQKEKETGTGRIWDVYILCDRIRDWQTGPFWPAAGALMPPNAVFLSGTPPVKAAVMRVDQFETGAAGRDIRPHIWARFAQPCRILYHRGEFEYARVMTALESALVTFHRQTLPFLPGQADLRTLWERGLSRTYAQEWRSEKSSRPAQIFNAAPEEFAQRTTLALPRTGYPVSRDSVGRITLNWPARRIKIFQFRGWLRARLAKALTFLQLIKSTWTFDGAAEYAAWKIARHSGITIELTRFQKRHPLIGAWPVLWQLYKKGGFR